MIISLLLMFIVADGCVFARLAGAEDVTIKLMGLLMSERGREKNQEVRVSVLLLLGIFRININVSR